MHLSVESGEICVSLLPPNSDHVVIHLGNSFLLTLSGCEHPILRENHTVVTFQITDVTNSVQIDVMSQIG